MAQRQTDRGAREERRKNQTMDGTKSATLFWTLLTEKQGPVFPSFFFFFLFYPAGVRLPIIVLGSVGNQN